MHSESNIEESVSEIVGIFVYFYSRDSFFKHYQKYFSNRLLNATSKNKEAEKSLIAKFKVIISADDLDIYSYGLIIHLQAEAG